MRGSQMTSEDYIPRINVSELICETHDLIANRKFREANGRIQKGLRFARTIDDFRLEKD